MFDKLIESEPQGAEFHGRKRYFMVSSVVMGILFITAVVFSLYAADISLGTDNFQLMTMTAPVTEAAAQPEVEQPRQQRAATTPQNVLPTRSSIMASVDEPTIAPDSVSVAKNTQLARPKFGDFRIDTVDSDPGSHSGLSRSTRGAGTDGPATLSAARPVENEVSEVTPPPPPVRKAETKPITSLGVINGRAAYLPKPTYSAAAIAVNAQGKVDVQVLIDETGKVISAKALGGHPLLRDAAVRAAQNAKFTPTLLSHVPVKVTGVIVYNFTR
jgi:TonB family protein